MRISHFIPREQLNEYVRLGLFYRGDLLDNTYYTKDECIWRMRTVFAWRAANEFSPLESRAGSWNTIYEMVAREPFRVILAFARLRRSQRIRIDEKYMNLTANQRREFNLWHAIQEVNLLKI